MPPFTPRKTLLLLLAVALAILGAGLWMARRQETVRITRNRESLHRFADSLQQEIQSLIHLYETHLRRVAREARRDNQFALREACDRLVGIRQFSWIHGAARVKENLHLAISPASAEPLPTPILEGTVIA